MLTTELFKLPPLWPGTLSISPRPRGSDWLGDEIAGWLEQQISLVVSLLTSDEQIELDLTEEASIAEDVGLRFLRHSIEDRNIPEDRQTFADLMSELQAKLTAGANVLLHCRQGIGRTGMVATCFLIESGMEPESAIRLVSKCRGVNVPETKEQTNWCMAFKRSHLDSLRTTKYRHESE